MAAHYRYLLRYASNYEPRTAVNNAERAIADSEGGRAFNVTFATRPLAWTLGGAHGLDCDDTTGDGATGDDAASDDDAATGKLSTAEIVLGVKFDTLLRLCLDGEALALLNRAARQRCPDTRVDATDLMRVNTNDVGDVIRKAIIYASAAADVRHNRERRGRRWSPFMESLLGKSMEAYGLSGLATSAYTRALESHKPSVVRMALAGLRRGQVAPASERLGRCSA
jgi:hypothetical protein